MHLPNETSSITEVSLNLLSCFPAVLTVLTDLLIQNLLHTELTLIKTLLQYYCIKTSCFSLNKKLITRVGFRA